MKIPQGNFGNVIAEPQRQVFREADNQVANAAIGLANTVKQEAKELEASEQAKSRANAASTLATLTNDMHDIHDEVGRDIATGKLKTTDGLSTYQQRVNDAKKTRTEGLSADQLQIIDNHVITTGGSLERNLKGTIIKRNDAETDAGVMAVGEQLQRAAMRDLPGSIGRWGATVDATNWGPDKKAQQKQLFVEGAAFNFANKAIEGAAVTENVNDRMGLLTDAITRLEGPDGEQLDPAKRTALITKAYAYKNGVEAASIREAEKTERALLARENDGVTAHNEAADLMAKGRYFSPEFINELTARTTGTKMAGQVLELVKSQAQVAGFASLSIPKQEAQIERMRAAGSDPKVGVDPMEQKVQEQYQRIHDESARAYKEDPWKAAQERAVIQDSPTVSMTNIAQAQQILAERMQTIGVVEVAAGAKISPLKPEEAAGIGRLVRSLPPDQQSGALAGFGTIIKDGDRLAALAKQIDDKDKVLGTAMMIGDLKTTQGRYVSELVLKGDRAIRDKTVKVDGVAESGWRAKIAEAIGDAYPNQQLRDKIIEAGYYIQAGLKSEGTDDIDRAVRLATGGGVIEHNRSKIPLPQGMEESHFEKRIKAITPQDLAAQAPGGMVFSGKNAVPLEQFVNSLPDAALEHAGQGRYAVKAGMGYVTRADGKKLVIEVRHGN